MVPSYADYKNFKQPKTNDCRINFGLLNFTPMDTNPIKCVELFISILKKNPNLKLFIKGENPYTNNVVKNNEAEKMYYNKLFSLISNYKNNIFVDYSEDINSWLSKIGTLFLFKDDLININFVKLGMGYGCVPYIDSSLKTNLFPSKFFNILNTWNKDLSDECRNHIMKSYNLNLDYCNKISNFKSNFVSTIISGGFGNQLFMIFNLIAVSGQYNLDFKVCIDHGYYDTWVVKRKPPTEYNLFKNIKFLNPKSLINETDFYKEKEYKYNNIKLNPNKNYILEGYFQSFKYFWNHKDEIKKYLYIDQKLLTSILKKYKLYGKPILSIHLRLGDYLFNPDYHPVPPLEYYKQALSYYNLDKYQIILFSDDVNLAKQKLSSLNLKYINANDIHLGDEEQFYMLMLSDVRVCSNSTFSILAAYLNEMYLFKENCEYIFPHKYFGHTGPEFSNNDFKLNYKFYFINYDSIPEIYTKKYDVVTNLHIKDKDRYKDFLKYNKKYLLEADKFYYVSYQEYDINSNYIPENNYPFSKKEVIDYIKDYVKSYRWGWYYQQLLKLYIFRINVSNKDNVLICDSDLLFLKNIRFFESGKPKLFKRNTDANEGKIHDTYLKAINYLVPEIEVETNNSGICHFMLFNKDKIEELLSIIENKFNKPAWQAILDSVIDYINKYGYEESLFSEYELYYSFIKDKDIYLYDYNFKYIDAPLSNLSINDDLNLIADHHYQSRGGEDWKKDNLVEEEILESKKLCNIFPREMYSNFCSQINDIFSFNCNLVEDRKKIIKKNEEINNYLRQHNVIKNLEIEKLINFVFKEDFINYKLKYADYSKFKIIHNKEGELKNHILIYNKNKYELDERILNVNYTIVSDDIKYHYVESKLNYKDRENLFEFIIFDDDESVSSLEKNNLQRLDLFLSSKTLLLQICIPNFDILPLNLKNHYETWDIDFFWNVKFDKYLCEKFLKENYHYLNYFCYSLIYSITARTDFIRHLFLYKFGGCYFDLSVKLINDEFLKFIKQNEFITCRDEDHDSLQNGILYFKNTKNLISRNFILEILTGVLNYNSNTNNKLSEIFKQNPDGCPFFYGPTTLYKIYEQLKDYNKCKIFNTYLTNRVEKGENHVEFESKSIDKETKTEYLQVKYIGYNEDLRKNTKNTHYSENWKKNKHFYSAINYFDKILVINLKHREDRKQNIEREFQRINIESDKLVFIEAVFDEKNGACGCSKSHLLCTEYALNNNLDNVLILEDDYNFIEKIEILNNELTKFLCYNLKWDAILFNISEHGPPINLKTNHEKLYKNLWSHSAGAYALNKNIFYDRIKNLQKSIQYNLGPHDFHWNQLKIKYDWFIINNTINHQIPSYSDIEKQEVDYKCDYKSIFY